MNKDKKREVISTFTTIAVHLLLLSILMFVTLKVAKPDTFEDGVPVLLGNVEDATGPDLNSLPAEQEETDLPEPESQPEEDVRKRRHAKKLLRKPLRRLPQKKLHERERLKKQQRKLLQKRLHERERPRKPNVRQKLKLHERKQKRMRHAKRLSTAEWRELLEMEASREVAATLLVMEIKEARMEIVPQGL